MGQALEALDGGIVTEEMLVEALIERIDEIGGLGGSFLSPAEFYKPGDLERYKQASAWWPTDAPQSCALPTLRELAMTIAGGAGTTPMPFMQALTVIWTRCVEWLKSEGRNTVNPNETAAERKRRLGREATARHRRLNAEAGSNTAADNVKALYARYIAACQARKAAAQEHDSAVAAAKSEWEAAKAAL